MQYHRNHLSIEDMSSHNCFIADTWQFGDLEVDELLDIADELDERFERTFTPGMVTTHEYSEYYENYGAEQWQQQTHKAEQIEYLQITGKVYRRWLTISFLS